MQAKGDAHVGFRTGDAPELARWAAKQRADHAAGTLSTERRACRDTLSHLQDSSVAGPEPVVEGAGSMMRRPVRLSAAMNACALTRSIVALVLICPRIGRAYISQARLGCDKCGCVAVLAPLIRDAEEGIGQSCLNVLLLPAVN